MKINLWLASTADLLKAYGVETARLDALVLLSDVTGRNRAHLLAHPELEITAEQQNSLQKLLKRRLQHEPLAYIRGKVEFYGREFYINESVLTPRPESESIISLLKTCFPGWHPGKQGEHLGWRMDIVDAGTGSGALAVTAKLEIPEATVTAIDIDEKCLEIAQKNANKHKVAIEFKQGNLLEPVLSASPYPGTIEPLPSDDRFSEPSCLIVLANLPYVPNDYQINQAALHEPKLAIFGGKDGLDLYRTMFAQLTKCDADEIFVITESLPFQHSELLNIATTHDYTQITKEGLVQVFRKRA